MEQKKEETVLTEDKQKLLQLSSISIALDGYNDIFSDFDPRPYNVRALSDDFIVEAKKASRDKEPGKFELKFLIPDHERKKDVEQVIKKRLRSHFKSHFQDVKKERDDIIKKGAVFVAVGIVFMFIATYILFYYSEKGIFINFLIVLLEPAGWFLFWEGLDQVVFETKRKKPTLDFNNKMSKCEITFISYKP